MEIKEVSWNRLNLIDCIAFNKNISYKSSNNDKSSAYIFQHDHWKPWCKDWFQWILGDHVLCGSGEKSRGGRKLIIKVWYGFSLVIWFISELMCQNALYYRVHLYYLVPIWVLRCLFISVVFYQSLITLTALLWLHPCMCSYVI